MDALRWQFVFHVDHWVERLRLPPSSSKANDCATWLPFRSTCVLCSFLKSFSTVYCCFRCPNIAYLDSKTNPQKSCAMTVPKFPTVQDLIVSSFVERTPQVLWHCIFLQGIVDGCKPFPPSTPCLRDLCCSTDQNICLADALVLPTFVRPRSFDFETDILLAVT